MKKSFVSLLLAACLAFTITLPASAVSSLTPEELYQEYLKIADDVNMEYGTNISITPFEEMDPTDMPSVEEVYSDVSTLAEFFANASTSSVPLDSNATRGLGNNPVSTEIKRTYGAATIKFLASTTVVVNQDTSGYFLDYVYGTSVINTYAPTGYEVTHTSNSNWILSSSKKSGVITRTFRVEYGSAQTNYTITASVVVSTTTGRVTISPV